MKLDGSILVDDPRDAGARARTLEEAGYDGGFTFEGPHDPFLPLAVAAEHTERLELATAIAVFFAGVLVSDLVESMLSVLSELLVSDAFFSASAPFL